MNRQKNSACARDIISGDCMIIENVIGNIKKINVNGRIEEKILLDREQLYKTHQKLVSEAGGVYAVSLSHGETLEPGDIVYEDASRVVYIELRPEDALVIYPKGTVQWARAAYNIGNMHHGAYICEDRIIITYDEILESLMKKLGVACERSVCKIDGVRANASQAHTHGHSHE